MAPLAPGLFSAITPWPTRCDSQSAVMRAMPSVTPPGGNGTTMRTGLCGHCCETEGTGSASINAPRSSRRTVISASLDQCGVYPVRTGEGTCVVADAADDLQTERHAVRRLCRGDRNARHVEQRPHHVHRDIAGRSEACRSFASRCRSEQYIAVAECRGEGRAARGRVLPGAQVLLRIERESRRATLAQARIEELGEAAVFVGEAARDLVPEDGGMARAQSLEPARQLDIVCSQPARRILERLAHLRLGPVPFIGPA